MSEGQGPPQSAGAAFTPAGPVTPAAPAGWYRDPSRPDHLRWWDGTNWTGHTPPGSGRPGAGPAPAEGPPDGLAVASLVLGIVGVFILALPFGFVALRRIRRSAGRRGRGLATAGVVLGFGWILIFAVAGLLAASGVFDHESNAERFAGEEAEVATVIDEFDAAPDDSGFENLCDEVFAPQLEARIAAGVGESCEEFYAGILERRGFFAPVEIEQLTVEGTVARVRIDEGGKPALLILAERESRWRIVAIR